MHWGQACSAREHGRQWLVEVPTWAGLSRGEGALLGMYVCLTQASSGAGAQVRVRAAAGLKSG